MKQQTRMKKQAERDEQKARIMDLLKDFSPTARAWFFGTADPKTFKPDKNWAPGIKVEAKKTCEAVAVGTEILRLTGDLNLVKSGIEQMADYDTSWAKKNLDDVKISIISNAGNEALKKREKREDDKRNGKAKHFVDFTLDGNRWSVDVNPWLLLAENLQGYYLRVAQVLKQADDLDHQQAIWDRDRSRWLVWSGSRWDETDQSIFYELMDQIVEVYTNFEMFNRVEDENKKFKFMGKLGDPSNFDKVLKRLKSARGLGIAGLKTDQRYDLLNVKNGVVSLTTGELLPAKKSYLMTKTSPVSYDPNAKAPKTWMNFLRTSFQGDTADVLKADHGTSWIQRAFGYLLWGNNPQQLIYLLYGPKARNGKTTTLKVIAGILGSKEDARSAYTRQEDVQILMSNHGRSGQGPTPALAQSENNRLMVLSEPKAGDVLDSGLVKSFTGDGMISARMAYQNSRNFEPTAKPVIASNWLPTSDGDAGVMRRFLMIPYNHHVAEYSMESDPEIDDKLWNERVEILTWLVKGCVELHKIIKERQAQKADLMKKIKAGKNPTIPRIYSNPIEPYPVSVSSLWSDYMYGSNSVSQFLRDRLYSKQEYWNWLCGTSFNVSLHGEWSMPKSSKIYPEALLVADPAGYCKKRDLYKFYKAWCSENGISRPFTSVKFNRNAKNLLATGKVHGEAIYLGVVITRQVTSYDYPRVKDPYSMAVYTIQKMVEDKNATLRSMYNDLRLDDGWEHVLSSENIGKVLKAIQGSDAMYCGKMAETLVGYTPVGLVDPYPADGPDDHRKPDPETVKVDEMFANPGTTMEDVKDEDFE